jgi:hypothetical protein
MCVIAADLVIPSDIEPAVRRLKRGERHGTAGSPSSTEGRLGLFEIGTETVFLVAEDVRGFPSPVWER